MGKVNSRTRSWILRAVTLILVIAIVMTTSGCQAIVAAPAIIGGSEVVAGGVAVSTALTAGAITVSVVGTVLVMAIPTGSGSGKQAKTEPIQVDLTQAAAERATLVTAFGAAGQEARSGEQEIAGGTARAELILSADGCTFAFLADFQREHSNEWFPMFSLGGSFKSCAAGITGELLDEVNEILITAWGQSPFGVLLRALLTGIRAGLGLLVK